MAIPSDELRLARAFGFQPIKKVGKAIAIASLGFLGVVSGGSLIFLVPAGAALLSTGALTARDYARIARGLRELEAWDFPVTGYRAWILAMTPTFDLELRRDVPLDLLEASLTAVDATIVVERRPGNIIRVITRGVDLPKTRKYPAVEVGDRRLLHEIHERVLAPLHADVGIVAMRMGDRATMTALLPARTASSRDEAVPEPSEVGGGAFREQGMAAPLALQVLMNAGVARARPPSDARRASKRLDRIMYATGHTPSRVSTVVGVTLAGGVTGITFGPIGGLLGLGVGLIAGVATNLGRNRAHMNVLRSSVRLQFPVEDYEDWLISGHPIFDVEFSEPPDRAWLEPRLVIHAYSIKAHTQVPWVENTTWLSSTVLRVETRPMLVEPSDNSVEPFYGGSHVLFQQLLRDVLLPLNRRTPIVAIRMGGFSNRRAD